MQAVDRMEAARVAESNEAKAIELVKERVSAAGGEVVEASAYQKSRDAYVVTVVQADSDAERQAVVTMSDLGQ
jgi:hypothetical protein